jgi:hypothetical protein
MEERRTYQDIRREAMEKAYLAARSQFHPSRVPHTPDIRPQLFTRFFTETYDSYDDDLDMLMIRTLELLLWQGEAPKMVHADCTHIIEEILARKSFEGLVRDIPEKEAEELRYDLVLLKFLPGPLHR